MARVRGGICAEQGYFKKRNLDVELKFVPQRSTRADGVASGLAVGVLGFGMTFGEAGVSAAPAFAGWVA